MKYFILFLMINCSFVVFSQTENLGVIPPSTEAASLGLYGQFQVGNFTGTTNVSIPIFELTGSQISCNVSLAYNSSGIRIEENSSWVGANWSLIAGGLISRNVRGIADDIDVKGLFYRSLPQVSYSEDIDNCDLEDYYANRYDSEPDIYTYSFMGYSGKIFFDENLNPVTVPRQPLSIDPVINQSTKKITGWLVIDEKGFKYLFETLATKRVNGNSDTDSKSWYLEKVISADNQDTLSFNYDNYSTIYSQVFFSQNLLDGEIGSYYLTDLTQNSTVIYEDNVYVTSIVSSNGSIIFSKSSRTDDKITNMKQLDSIQVYNKYGDLIKKLEFTYDNTGERLFLEEVEEVTDNNTIRYEMVYSGSYAYLPDRFQTVAQAYPSYPIDYWGYYNGVSSNTHLIPYLYSGIRNFTPANRLPSLTYTKIGSLEKITYPTGGYTKFYYELNKTTHRPLFYGSNISNASEYDIGGLRVSKIENYDDNNTLLERRKYDYMDQGYLSSIPIYGYTFTSNRHSDPCPDAGDLTVKTISSSSQAYLNSISGSHIYYPEVKEIYGENGENGYSIYEYSSDNSEITEYMFQPPFTPNDGTSSHRAGLLLRKADFDASGNPQKEIKNVYTISNSLKDTIRGLRVLKSYEYYITYIPESGCYQGKGDCSYDEFYSAFYNLISEWQYKSSDTTRIYDPSDSSKYVEKINVYQYGNTAHQQLSSVTTYDSRNLLNETQYYYPGDIGTGVYATMDAGNMKSYPIEQVTKVNGQYTGSKLTTYKQENGFYVPENIYSLKTSAPLSSFTYFNGTSKDSNYGTLADVQFVSYTTNGKIQQVVGRDGLYTYYVWAYNAVYPVAKIISASSTLSIDSAQNAINSISLSGSDDKISVDSDISAIKSAVETYISSTKINYYTYKPLFGVTSQTDPNGTTTYYSYDDYGRLKEITDDDANIVNQYNYHYAQ